MGDVWQATLGTGNVSYQQLWPPSGHDAENKKKRAGPAKRKGHSAVAVHETDPCLVGALRLGCQPLSTSLRQTSIVNMGSKSPSTWAICKGKWLTISPIVDI